MEGVPAHTITGTRIPKSSESTAINLTDRPMWQAMHVLDAKILRPKITAGPPTKPESQISLRTFISNTTSLAELRSVLLKAVSLELSADLGVEEDALCVGRPLYEAGVDSLMAVQSQIWFCRELDVDVSMLSIMSKREDNCQFKHMLLKAKENLLSH
ncbi:hypothetical protein Daus18300_007776 [Diaporthe australafricana]|uniref:Carrier domain-containing protein n=1 Tax=Diaporthe australafricana TaxID=127596 RepID=A0ABR3WLH7_9PEZI